ncbi:MAG TPA: hypothetical protein VGJ84_06245, partial [Polyangiaceae bacterium]
MTEETKTEDLMAAVLEAAKAEPTAIPKDDEEVEGEASTAVDASAAPAPEPAAPEVSASGDEEGGFELGESFVAGSVGGGLGLGPLEAQYEELFAEVLQDGIITAEERARLERAADNLGLDRQRLF